MSEKMAVVIKAYIRKVRKPINTKPILKSKARMILSLK
jgi:hypothetical protein